MNRGLIRFAPNVWANKDMLLWILAVCVLASISFYGLGKFGFAYAEAEETTRRIEEMTAFIADWKKQSAQLEQEVYRPIAIGRMDEVQDSILLLLSSNRLDLVSFRSVREGEDKAVSGKSFALTCRGTWESTVRMLETFRAKDALIGVQRLKMEPDRAGGVNTTLEYKIYVK